MRPVAILHTEHIAVVVLRKSCERACAYANGFFIFALGLDVVIFKDSDKWFSFGLDPGLFAGI